MNLNGDAFSEIQKSTHQKPHFHDVHPENPDIVMGRIWLPDTESNGVKIIELDSKDTSTDDKDLKFSHVWDYVNRDRVTVESPKTNYTVNSKARERKRLANRNCNQVFHPGPNLESQEDYMRDLFHDKIHESINNNLKEDNLRSNQINCLTIIKNPDVKSSASSSDNDIEFFNGNDSNAEHYECNGDDTSYEGEIYTYNADVDEEKRTFIYSFKNKHHFTENYHGYSSSENSSTTSVEMCEKPDDKDTNDARVPTPIPRAYVPRLNLSLPPALPTVTEVTEPKLASNEIVKTECNIKKRFNGWFTDICPETEETVNNQKISNRDNVINWMCLSPREKRKRSSVANRVSFQIDDKLPVVREASHEEENSHSIMIYNKSVKREIIQNATTNNFGTVIENNIGDQVYLFKDITIEDIDNEIEDQGDHDENQTLKKPKIQINSKPKSRVVTDPIELRDSENWIIEENLVDLENKEDTEDLSRKLWAKNMVLLKPSQWSEYFPVTDSVPSLHLSLETVIEEEMSWFRRIIRCFKCFK